MTHNTFLTGTRRYIVTASAAVAKLHNGDETYVYKGGILPLETAPSSIESLLGAGLIREWVTS